MQLRRLSLQHYPRHDDPDRQGQKPTPSRHEPTVHQIDLHPETGEQHEESWKNAPIRPLVAIEYDEGYDGLCV